jgi:hypothetical protein
MDLADRDKNDLITFAEYRTTMATSPYDLDDPDPYFDLRKLGF